MQVSNLINQLASRVVAALRQRHSERLSAALSRELALADTRVRADIQQLIAQATTSNATLAAAPCASKASTPMASAARPPGGFRTAPVTGLPTHIQYLSA